MAEPLLTNSFRRTRTVRNLTLPVTQRYRYDSCVHSLDSRRRGCVGRRDSLVRAATFRNACKGDASRMGTLQMTNWGRQRSERRRARWMDLHRSTRKNETQHVGWSHLSDVLVLIERWSHDLKTYESLGARERLRRTRRDHQRRLPCATDGEEPQERATDDGVHFGLVL